MYVAVNRASVRVFLAFGMALGESLLEGPGRQMRPSATQPCARRGRSLWAGVCDGFGTAERHTDWACALTTTDSAAGHRSHAN